MRRLALAALLVCFVLASALSVQALPIPAQSIVVNGAFTTGNAGFTSTYIYKTPAGPSTLDDWATYTIHTDPSAVKGAYPAAADHTGDAARLMMILYGHAGLGTSQVVWQGTVGQDLVVGRNYDFSVWVLNLMAGIPSSIRLTVGGAIVTTVAVDDVGTWRRIFGTFTAGSARPVLAVLNHDVGSDPNGFALDDINIFAPGTQTPPPAITSIAPNVGPAAGGTTTIITGTNLMDATVTFGGTAAVCVVNSATQVTCTTPAHAAGAVDVVLTTGGGTATSTGGFTYVAGPTITSVAPNVGPTAGGTVVVIVGTLLTGATVTFGGTAATCVVNSAVLVTCVSPAHAAGAVDVAVTTSGGTATAAGAFTYVAPPTITGVVPNSGPASGGTSVVVTGTNLTNGVLSFGGGDSSSGAQTNALASCTVNSPTQVTCTTPPHAPGAVDVAVTTPGGTFTLPGGFTYLPVVPALPDWRMLVLLMALASGLGAWTLRRTRTA